MMTRRLIVNADDFGQSDAITDGIVQAAAAGAVTSTTLLANGGAAAERALKLSADLPRLGVGLHLNLTQGRPVADPARVPMLVDKAGVFCRGPAGLLARTAVSRSFREQVRIEWAAQIEWMLGRGRRPTHLDSHKHVHMAPALFSLACELARRFGIAGVRLAGERIWRSPLAAASAPLTRPRRMLQLAGSQALRIAFARRNRRRRARAGLAGNDRFFGMADTGGWGEPAMHGMLRRLPDGVSELMVHPGLDDPCGKGRLAASRPRELAVLLAADLPGLTARLSIEMIHYGDLSGDVLGGR